MFSHLSKEERANTISHGIGVLFALIMFPILILQSNKSEIDLVALIIYGICFIGIFLASTIYHYTSDPGRKQKMQRIDHISIFFMIAGTYTPFIFTCLEGNFAWIFFGIIWSIVLIGLIFKIFFTGRYEGVSLALYIGMGWMVVFIIKPFLATFSMSEIVLTVLGGIEYTGGVYFYSHDHRPFYHLIWHIFVLAGAIFHFSAVWSFMS